MTIYSIDGKRENNQKGTKCSPIPKRKWLEKTK
jgi:hypothetical protein